MDNAQCLPVNSWPRLVFVDEPESTFRFRYISEKRHGCLKAKSSRGPDAQAIRLKLENFDQGREAIIRCTPVTDTTLAPHAHRLDYGLHGDYQDVQISAKDDWIGVFLSLTIVCTDRRENKKNVKEILMRRLRRERPFLTHNQLHNEVDRMTDTMDYNRLKLKFQALSIDRKQLICPPIYSQTIQNSKGDLRIVRVDKTSGCCTGGEEVFIFVTKVDKMDIEIRFFELDDQKRTVWTDKGDFSSLDVWYQCAIVFKTPPYRDLDIDRAVTVQYQLHRPRTGCRSDPRSFTYIPRDMSDSRVRAKRFRPINYLQQPEASVAFHQPQTFGGPSHGNEPVHFVATEETSWQAAIPPLTRIDKAVDWPVQSNVQISEPSTLSGTLWPPKSIDFDYLLKCDPFDELVADSAGQTAAQLVDVCTRDHSDSLHVAVVTGNQPLVVQLLSNGADPTALDSKGHTPIHIAAGSQSSDCLSLLLDSKADPADLNLNQTNYDGLTALHLAVMVGSLKNVELLVTKGADVNYQEKKQGKSALHIAVEMQDKNIINHLLQNSFLDVNLQSFNGVTAFHLSVAAGLQDVTTALIRRGADPNIENYLSTSN